jgi:replicative superfamily II helicase
VLLTPPPKEELGKNDLVPIEDLPAFARKAFSSQKGTTHLNRIQSKVYPCAFKTSNNILIAAPTGAGKTNIALMTILREIYQHVDLKDQGPWNMKDKPFKIVYIAPLKALASEITEKFHQALGYLGVKVRELTGDMSLTKQEIIETHILVATPEKWDVVTRKTDGVMDLVTCLIIDEIHLLND